MTLRIPGLWRIADAGRRLRRAMAFPIFHAGVLELYRRRRNRRPLPVILMYHSVSGEGISPDIWVSAAHFDAHMSYLSTRYQVVSLNTIAAALETGQALPRCAAAITFDDGYRDNAEIALPILQKHRCLATVFVTVEPVDSGEVLWPQRIWTWLYHTDVRAVDLAWQSTDARFHFARHFPLRTDSDRDEARMQLRAFTGTLPLDERGRFLSYLEMSLPDSATNPRSTSRTFATWDQLRQLRDGGVTIGGHTTTHPRLAVTAPEAVQSELVESRARLQRELGTIVDAFAYPFGEIGTDFNDDTVQAARSAGYRVAVAVGAPHEIPENRFALPRLYIPDDPVWRFAMRVENAAGDSLLLRWLLQE